jgi:hypothetical protein
MPFVGGFEFVLFFVFFVVFWGFFFSKVGLTKPQDQVIIIALAALLFRCILYFRFSLEFQMFCLPPGLFSVLAQSSFIF